MTKKTKAEKIAASLRAKRNVGTSVDAQRANASQGVQTLITPQEGMNTKGGGARVSAETDKDVYVPNDLRKTMVVTLCIVSLLTLVFVLQYKGYF